VERHREEEQERDDELLARGVVGDDAVVDERQGDAPLGCRKKRIQTTARTIEAAEAMPTAWRLPRIIAAAMTVPK
jgi:hypothetical protein